MSSYYVNLDDQVHKEWKNIIENGTLDDLKKFINEHDPHFELDYPAREAAQQGNLEFLKFFVSLGANVTSSVQKISDQQTYMFDESAIVRAARSGNPDVVNYLIDIGADVNEGGGKPLWDACREGHLEVVKTLFARGAKFFDQGHRALWAACSRNHIHTEGGSDDDHLELVKFLVTKGANIHAPMEKPYNWDCRYQSPIGVAICNEDSRIAKYLFSLGVDPRQDNGNPLDEAEDCGNDEMYEFIFKLGNYSVNESQVQGHFTHMGMSGSVKIIKFLLDQGMDINVEEGKILHNAAWNHNIDLVKFLLARGANVHANDDSAITSASMSAGKEIIQLLLDAGANPNGKISSNGNSRALMNAFQFGQYETVKLLVEAGAQFDKNNVISHVNRSQYPKIITYLLTKGATLDCLTQEEKNKYYVALNPVPVKKLLPPGKCCKGTGEEIKIGDLYYQCRNEYVGGPHPFLKKFMDSIPGEICSYWCGGCCCMLDDGAKLLINLPPDSPSETVRKDY